LAQKKAERGINCQKTAKLMLHRYERACTLFFIGREKPYKPNQQIRTQPEMTTLEMVKQRANEVQLAIHATEQRKQELENHLEYLADEADDLARITKALENERESTTD
jgi:hypothetical protein